MALIINTAYDINIIKYHKRIINIETFHNIQFEINTTR